MEPNKDIIPVEQYILVKAIGTAIAIINKTNDPEIMDLASDIADSLVSVINPEDF